MLYAITSYFNPCGYRKRRENYATFREHLSVPLITVELGFEGRFDLGPDDAEVYVPLGDGDIMFQKERLLNIAAAHLPADCTAVAWLDCDIVFSDDTWAEQTLAELQTHPVVQPFATLHQLEEFSPVDVDLARETLPTHESIPHWLATDRHFHQTGLIETDSWLVPAYMRSAFRTGIAWAARRDFFDRVGLYDACIVGSGDMAFASALYGCPDVAVRLYQMTPEFEDHYRRWYDRLQQEFPLTVSGLSTTVLQLWHGRYENRRYRQRHERFTEFGFCPQHDLTAGSDGAWRWSNPQSAVARFTRDYFYSRQEDGIPLSEEHASAAVPD